MVVRTYSRYIDLFNPLIVDFKESFKEIKSNFIKPDANDIYHEFTVQNIQKITDFFESKKLTSTAQKMAVISLLDVIESNKDIESFVKLLNDSGVTVAKECTVNYNKFVNTLKTSIEAIEIETVDAVKSKSKHPFHDQDTLELFLYLHEWMKPHNKAKYSYIFEHLKDYLGLPLNETEYFTYVNELTGLGMSLRYQHSANVKMRIEQVKDLVRKFKESKG